MSRVRIKMQLCMDPLRPEAWQMNRWKRTACLSMGSELPILVRFQMYPESLCESEPPPPSSHCPEDPESLLIHRHHLSGEQAEGAETPKHWAFIWEKLSYQKVMTSAANDTHSETWQGNFFPLPMPPSCGCVWKESVRGRESLLRRIRGFMANKEVNFSLSIQEIAWVTLLLYVWA